MTGSRLLPIAMLVAALLGCAKTPDSGTPTAGSQAPAPLQGTYWKLTQVGGDSVNAANLNREPYLQLSADKRVSGTGGCNRFMGSYELEGTKLSFGGLASTKMACPPGSDRDEALAAALGKTRGFQISADLLTLQDEGGAPLAQFQAATPPAGPQ